MCDPYPSAPRAPAFPMAPPQPYPGSSRCVSIPAMTRPAAPAAEPESASVTVLRALLADRRSSARAAGDNRDSFNRQADEYDRLAKEARERAEYEASTVAQAEGEISAILADIKSVGGRDE
jgi:hypothetical protein